MNHFKNNKDNYYDQDFLDTNFSELNLADIAFEDCSFDNCDFTEATLEDCKFIDCIFTNCNLSLIKIKETSFLNVNFSDSKLIGINWTEAKWPTIKLSCPLEFFACNIADSSFLGLHLQGMKCHKCCSKNVDFREAELSLSDFKYSDFSGALFANTNLFKSDFSHAFNYSIDVRINNIKQAIFTLPEAIGLLGGLGAVIVEE